MHAGAWYVRATDGTYWKNALHPELEALLDEHHWTRGAVQTLVLGPHSTFYAGCELCTVWRASTEFDENIKGF